eukprot:746676-Hanusia_phi.AAC.9
MERNGSYQSDRAQIKLTHCKLYNEGPESDQQFEDVTKYPICFWAQDIGGHVSASALGGMDNRYEK